MGGGSHISVVFKAFALLIWVCPKYVPPGVSLGVGHGLCQNLVSKAFPVSLGVSAMHVRLSAGPGT